MREEFGDIWSYIGKADILCIPTNGFVKKNGHAVMGAGVAKQAKERYLSLITETLGEQLLRYGNKVHFLGWEKTTQLISFPTKHAWFNDSDIELIKTSALQLKELVGEDELLVVLPRPGCGNGGLSWDKVKEAISDILDDRFLVVQKDR